MRTIIAGRDIFLAFSEIWHDTRRNGDRVSGSVSIGLSGSLRNACVAACEDDRVLGICQQERITRVRGAGFNASGLPDEALDEVLRQSGRTRRDVVRYALADSGSLPDGIDAEAVLLDHHHAHACAAFLPSSFESAAIVVGDHESPHVSVWEGKGGSVTRVEWPWRGPGFADVYSQCADAVGFKGAEQRMEALARLNPNVAADWASPLFTLRDDRIELAPGWRERVASACGNGTHVERARVAAALQARISELLVEFLSRVRRRLGYAHVCLGGGLFYNSHLNTQAKLSAVFDDVFVPLDPGNSGLAVGAALHAGEISRQTISPFLGPSYTPNDVKAVLDNCKLTYRWVSETEAIAVTVDALRKGQLVGWFDGAMESGPRALGARSILANPFSKYVLDNLNRFLKHRDPWRGYALSGLQQWVNEHFAGPPTSPFMECDFAPKEADRFQHVLPGCEATVRVQTVGPDGPPRFQALLRAFGDAAGGPVLVNTSFNGFHEPIVCNPRDAIRVFYGSGIDMLVFGQFILTK